MKTKCLYLVAICLVGMGCASTSAPPRVLKSPEHEKQDVFGGWVEVNVQGGEQIDGELLALGRDTMYVIRYDNSFVSIPRQDISYAKLTAYGMQRDMAALAVFTGTISTLSHGFYLVLSAPMWMFAGSASAGSHAKTAQILYEGNSDWYEMEAFARYPQGMPDLDRSRLKAYGELNQISLSDKENSKERSSWRSRGY